MSILRLNIVEGEYRFGGRPLSDYVKNDPDVFERSPEWRGKAWLIFRGGEIHKDNPDGYEMMLTKEGVGELIQQLQQIAERM